MNLNFLLDQNVDDRVAEFLKSRGHKCLKVRELVATDAPDQLIAIVAESESLIIVTHDADFGQIRRLLPSGHRPKTASGAGVVHLQVRESQALQRLENCCWYIEMCNAHCIQHNIRMQIRITATGMTLVDNARQKR